MKKIYKADRSIFMRNNSLTKCFQMQNVLGHTYSYENISA